MGKDNPSKPQKHRDNTKLKTVFSVILFVLSLIMEFYVIMNDPINYTVIGCITVLCIIMLYFCLSGIFQMIYIRDMRREEQYDSIFKSEKASYLMLKKSFDDIQEKLDRMEIASTLPSEKIIEAQKAIAKVTINRSRENADAMMNSNHQLVEKLEGFSNLILNNNELLLNQEKHLLAQNSNEVIIKQQELMNALKDLELSIKNDMLQVINRSAVVETIQSSGSGVIPDGEVSLMEDTLEEETLMEETPIVEEPLVEEPLIEEPLIEESLIEESLIEEPLIEESLIEEPLEEEPLINETPVVEEVAEESVIEESPTVKEGAVVNQQPVSVSNDSNHVMTPDEIAAMIANMDGHTIEEESESTVVEELETLVEESEPVIEDKPPMPDMSDPNKMLTPEEIAEMIAKMQ